MISLHVDVSTFLSMYKSKGFLDEKQFVSNSDEM